MKNTQVNKEEMAVKGLDRLNKYLGIINQKLEVIEEEGKLMLTRINNVLEA